MQSVVQAASYKVAAREGEEMATKGPFCVVGAMSGTSLDGVDAAQIVTDGMRVAERGPTAYRPYTATERRTLRTALGKWPDDDISEAAEIIETAHAEVLSRFPDAEVFGFHGQTLAHDPAGRGTHQAGDGAILAEVLGRAVVWDFRSNDVAMGGQGAPLAPFYHFALAQEFGATDPLAILNLGGVGNLTWIDPTAPTPETPGALLAFDTGPANAPIDDLIRARTGAARDEDGALASAGTADQDIVAEFLKHAYFPKIPPKSLDRNDFSALPNMIADLTVEDAAATLTAIVAACVATGLDHCPTPPTRLLVTGGGRHNPAIMTALASRLACPVASVEDVGLNGDMLEAEAFAFLAVRVLRGLPTSAPGTTGVAAAIGGGEISRPVT